MVGGGLPARTGVASASCSRCCGRLPAEDGRFEEPAHVPGTDHGGNLPGAQEVARDVVEPRRLPELTERVQVTMPLLDAAARARRESRRKTTA
jgi:hypothetical protein